MPPSIDELRSAAAELSAAGLPRAAEAIRRVLAGVDPKEAFGLKPRCGRSPLTLDRLQRRDCALRAMRARHFDDRSDAEAARAIAGAWSAYRRQRLAADRELSVMPGSYRDTPAEFLWHIGTIPADVPGPSRLQAILGEPENLTNSPCS